MLSALPGMAVAAHRFGSAAFIDCKPPLFRGEGDRVSGGGVSGWMGHKGGGLASLRSPIGLRDSHRGREVGQWQGRRMDADLIPSLFRVF